MPLLAHVIEVPDEEQPPQLPEPRPDYIPDAPYVTWQPDGGEIRVFTCGGEAHIMPGVTGLDLPPDSQFLTPLASGDGSLFDGRRRLPREVIFSVWITKNRSLIGFEAARRALMRDLDPAREGAFTWALPDGTRRSLRCRTSEVTPETGHLGAQGVNRGQWRVVLQAVDPYWRGEERRRLWSAPGAQDFYGGGTGAPPFIISDSNTLGTVTVEIDGEVETWPEWWLRGPMTTARLVHPTEGRIDLTPNLTGGKAMVIRTDPRLMAHEQIVVGDVVALTDGDWTVANSSLAWDRVTNEFPSLWPLQPGSQQIEVFAAGTGSASEVGMRYQIRYLTA